MDSVEERVTGWMKKQRDKHGLGVDYVENTVNEMTPFDLLRAISEAVSEMFEERQA